MCKEIIWEDVCGMGMTVHPIHGLFGMGVEQEGFDQNRHRWRKSYLHIYCYNLSYVNDSRWIQSHRYMWE